MGVLDLAISIVLAAGIAMEAQFLPATYGPCKGAENWNNGTDGRNFFLVANATGNFDFDGHNAAHGICYTMMVNWAMTIAIMYVALPSIPFQCLAMAWLTVKTQHPVYTMRHPQHDLRLLRQEGFPIMELDEISTGRP
jgi:hypothetical protein